MNCLVVYLNIYVYLLISLVRCGLIDSTEWICYYDRMSCLFLFGFLVESQLSLQLMLFEYLLSTLFPVKINALLCFPMICYTNQMKYIYSQTLLKTAQDETSLHLMTIPLIPCSCLIVVLTL